MCISASVKNAVGRYGQSGQQMCASRSSIFWFLWQRIIEQYAVEFDDTVEFGEDGTMRTGLIEAGISSKLAAGLPSSQDSETLWENDNRAQVRSIVGSE